MRRTLAIALVLAFYVPRLSTEGRAEPAGPSPTSARSGATRAFAGTRDIKTYTAQKQQQSYSRETATNAPVDKRAHAAVFAKGVRTYYPGAAPNQSRNRNVIDPHTLCVPGRRALLQR